MSLNERISQIITYSGLSSSDFADEIEVQRSNISHITSGRNKPSLEFITKIKNRFPEINLDWIVLAKGEMLEKTEEKQQEKKFSSPALPDLFNLINDEQFGVTESEDRILKEDFSVPQNQEVRESNKPESIPEKEIVSDSQRLEDENAKNLIQIFDNQENKIKRIVLFFENGKFESFEP
ncbi:MAG: helix-turn-helix transcriptional regulator [Bergeyella sp.]